MIIIRDVFTYQHTMAEVEEVYCVKKYHKETSTTGTKTISFKDEDGKHVNIKLSKQHDYDYGILSHGVYVQACGDTIDKLFAKDTPDKEIPPLYAVEK